MKCPVCKDESLENKETEPNLFAGVCPKCSGKWVSSNNYQKWLSEQSAILPELPADKELEITIPEFELARLCPNDGRILIKYRVGRNIPFLIDRCGNCAGVWLDEKEWSLLKERNLHDELNKVFTDHWQEEVKREETRKALEAIYREKFGAEDYMKLKDFKAWVSHHEKSDEIMAYLKDKNPLQF